MSDSDKWTIAPQYDVALSPRFPAGVEVRFAATYEAGGGAVEDRAASARRDLLAAVADLGLTAGENSTVEWLLRWEPETVANVTAVIRKARRAGVT